MACVGTLRPTDTVGRWGGDEFLAIVRNVNNEILKGLSNRCVALAAGISFSGSDNQPISLSISVGGTLARPDDSVEALIIRADGLMYESKTSGRARATIG
jgi:diguanylate cyclase (GGDEF)-like protein